MKNGQRNRGDAPLPLVHLASQNGGGRTIIVLRLNRPRRNALTAVKNLLAHKLPGISEITVFDSPEDNRTANALSFRERETLIAIAQGMSNKEIADALTISIRTVEGYRDSLKRKLGAKGTADLTRWAIRNRLVGF